MSTDETDPTAADRGTAPDPAPTDGAWWNLHAAAARMPAAPTPPPVPPAGVAGKRVKPWLARRAHLARTLRDVVDLDAPHLRPVADLWVASWAKTMPSIDFEARRAWFVDHLLDGRARGVRLRVARVETGDVAGFVMIDPATGWLDQIAVHPAGWGAGIAEALIRDAGRISPDVVALDVNVDNPRAVAFYERHGFVRVGEGVNPRSGLATLKLEWHPRADSRAGAAGTAGV